MKDGGGKTGFSDGREGGYLAVGFLEPVTILKDLTHFI